MGQPASRVLRSNGSATSQLAAATDASSGGRRAPREDGGARLRQVPVRVLSRLFRRLFLEKLVAAHAAGRLQFFGAHAKLADRAAFAQYLAPARGVEWVVYSKRPFGGPDAVLAYLSRYTHRVAISNSRLLAC